MTTSIPASGLLERYDSTESIQRLFRREVAAPTATDYGNLLANAQPNTGGPANSDALQLAADLNAARAQQYGATYSADGSPHRSTANTVLIGYG